ncbi:MAG: adenylate/guanylate cyclase domain-containing protein [Kangiellaceae bacterium]|nr:adenylate/guanylate cyclase domain-containing protein [Kangiellaceae bacterium]
MMLNKEKRRAVLFADISGSSALYKTKGNSQAKTIIGQLLSEIQILTIHHKGRVVKTIGDEVMVSFLSGQNCIDTAIAIQESFAASYTQHHLMVSIGVSFGSVLLENGDLFGETVNDAAFLTKVAKGSQILFSEAILEELTIEQKSQAREFDWVKFKGAKENSPIFRYYWQDSSDIYNETRFLSTEVVLDEVSKQILTLLHDDSEILIEPELTPFMIGRNLSTCQLVLDDTQVSREHCHISYSRGKFVLVDHSTNGCYLKPENGLEFYLRREEFPLLENSSLSLGVPAHKSTSHLIQIRYQNN